MDSKGNTGKAPENNQDFFANVGDIKAPPLPGSESKIEPRPPINDESIKPEDKTQKKAPPATKGQLKPPPVTAPAKSGDMALQDRVKGNLSKAKIPGTMAGLTGTQISEVFEFLKPQMAQALPKHLTPERMIMIATNVITANPKLAKCTVPSLIGAVMLSSLLQLNPSPMLGYCYFIPYGDQVRLQIGYKGWILMTRRSKSIKNIYAHVIYDGDEYSIELGANPSVKHTPKFKSTKPLFVYAVAHLTNGSFVFNVLTDKRVQELRMRNSSQGATPSEAWKTDEEEMYKAKALKNLCKTLPFEEEIAQDFEMDERAIEPSSFEQNQSGLLRLEAMIETPETGANDGK